MTIETTANGILAGRSSPATAIDRAKKLLANDVKVKVAGIDCDGILRGKVMHKDKFLSSLQSGFGMSSVTFGWDMHDVLFDEETSLIANGVSYEDLTALIDLDSFRRLPFEDDLAFFLLHFSVAGKPLSVDGRSMAKSLTEKLASNNFKALAGVELEFMNFQTPTQNGYDDPHGRRDLAAFLSSNSPRGLRPLTSGSFGYSVSRPILAKEYFHDIFDMGIQLNCPIEGWHTENGQSAYEAALMVRPVSEMADNVAIFKLLCKSVGVKHRVTPCFMAKPIQGLPGNSGHIHVSLTDLDGKNAFVRDSPDLDAPWSDLVHLSDTGRYFLAGVLDALPDIMPLFAPNVNSYKRLIENYWAPISVSWGFEDRLACIRLVAPPICKPSATRFEIRVPGADIHPHYALNAIFQAGWRGIEDRMALDIPPEASRADLDPAERLPRTLQCALERFSAKGSVARQIFGDEFVDHFAISRRHELKQWDEAVTDWEFNRYVETV